MRGNVILRLKNWHKFIIGMWSILLFAGVNGQSVEDQLYFITGVSSDKMDARFSCSLYRLEGAQVKNVNDIVNQDAGIDFIDIDYDAQRVVIGFPPVRPFGLSVLNMKSPGSTYGFSLPLPPQPEYAVVARYFVETQTQDFGLAERWFSAVGSEGGGAQARKADMLTVKWLFGSKRGSEILPGQKIRYCRWTGWSGTAVWTGGVMYVRAGRDGKLRQAGGDDSLEIPCPQALSSQLDKTFALAVNKSEVAELQPEEFGVLPLCTSLARHRGHGEAFLFRQVWSYAPLESGLRVSLLNRIEITHARVPAKKSGKWKWCLQLKATGVILI